MALYVHLVKMTHQGASKIREMYDFVGLWDWPNEVTALKLAGCAVSNGTVQNQTLPAFKIEDFFKVVSELPK
jgi:uncharacterized protein with GYD domain